MVLIHRVETLLNFYAILYLSFLLLSEQITTNLKDTHYHLSVGRSQGPVGLVGVSAPGFTERKSRCPGAVLLFRGSRDESAPRLTRVLAVALRSVGA